MNATAVAPARALVVDDNEMNRDVLSRRLQRSGHAVEVVDSGERALARLKLQNFDLILLDVMMPGIDGYEVLARLKQDPALRHIPVIMISALGETESVVRCLALGADDYLTKPFNPLILQARVDACLIKKRMHDGEMRHLQSMEREFEIGRAIQAGFLPESLPAMAGWDVAVRFRPARQVAGDFYDLFATQSGGIFIVVADVCDKGVGAALYMALFRTLIRATASQPFPEGTDATAILLATATLTNDYIARIHGRANMFATAFLGILDARTGSLMYVNAGHDPPLVASAEGGRRRLGLTGPALGLLAEQRFTVGMTHLGVGDLLLGYTDGVVESVGIEGAFGEARLLEALLDLQGSSDRMLQRIEAALDAFGDGAEASDDITMVALRRTAAAQAL
ncbi:PP2C family protein-serine/threonine phosphatase [Variovorax saccharolyticus]|uniref:PP2C family protein-serine/threonine phosphatase n=1 Tax=Variovorax saccharolyticus TaxID=3053516 RepID=UPI002576D3DC|nr:SpoIIE family protein phosphatase [Variovorax sp. J22R187]MDM0021481.1 SpoIIE family protein phosphatase [Variovorax sp. J22R187]